jgi:hypothetical protein
MTNLNRQRLQTVFERSLQKKGRKESELLAHRPTANRYTLVIAFEFGEVHHVLERLANARMRRSVQFALHRRSSNTQIRFDSSMQFQQESFFYADLQRFGEVLVGLCIHVKKKKNIQWRARA